MTISQTELLRDRQARIMAMSHEQRRAYQNELNRNGETVPAARPSHVRTVKPPPGPRPRPERRCRACQALLTRRTFASGRTETDAQLRCRLYCSDDCRLPHSDRGPSDVDRLMEAARTLPAEFSVWELIAATFTRCPGTFGFVVGDTNYCNSHKIYCLLSSRGGPVRRGMLRRVAPNRFRVVEGSNGRAL